MRKKTVITKLLQRETKVYYKVRQLLQSVAKVYYKMLKIKVCQVLESVRDCYCKARQVLQKVTDFITKCIRYYKVLTIITKWDITQCGKEKKGKYFVDVTSRDHTHCGLI